MHHYYYPSFVIVLSTDIELTGLCNISTVYISWNVSETVLCSLDTFNTVLEISGICVQKEWSVTVSGNWIDTLTFMFMKSANNIIPSLHSCMSSTL